MHSLALITMLVASSMSSDSIEDTCRDVESQVEAENQSNFNSLLMDSGFWLANSAAACTTLGCLWLFSGISFVALGAWVTLGVLSITGGVLTLIILFDLIDIGTQQNPHKEYLACKRRLRKRQVTYREMAY